MTGVRDRLQIVGRVVPPCDDSPRPHARRSRFLLLALLALAALPACVSTSEPVDLKLDDENRMTPGGRITFEVAPGNDTRRRGSALDLLRGWSPAEGETPVTARSAGIQPTMSLDGEVAYVKGSDYQDIAAGEFAEINFVDIPGPARVKLNSENVRAHLAARAGLRFYDVLSVEAILGFGLNHTDVRARSGNIDATEDVTRPGFLYGGRVSLRPIPLFDLYGQFARIDYLDNPFDVETQTTEIQAGIEINLTRHVAPFAGYRWWEYEQESFLSGSDLDLDIEGPTAGLSLRF